MIGNIVEISQSGYYLSLFRGFLKISQDKQEVGKVVLDDLTALIISAHDVGISKNIMVALGERNIPIVICGKNYHPLSLTLPIDSHYDSAGILYDQITLSQPLRKRLWQAIVKQKINNQAIILERHHQDHDVVKRLYKMANMVKSGDLENREAQAAQIYWPALFDKSFRRDKDGENQNALLNYGYTVLRSATARAVCGAGLHPALGVHHQNRKNAFCLVDDLMEPFRPLVDDIVKQLWDKQKGDYDGLTPDIKKELASVLLIDLIGDKGASPLVNCIGRMVVSLRDSIQNGKENILFPTLPKAGNLL